LRFGAADPSIKVTRAVSTIERNPVMDWEVIEGCSPSEPDEQGSFPEPSDLIDEYSDSFYWPESALQDDEWV